GNLQVKCRSVAVALGPEPSAMRFRDRATDGEPHAHAARLGRDEWLEDPFEVSRRNAAAAVRHRHLHARLFRDMARGKLQFAIRYRQPAHRLAGVHEEVQQNLLHLDAVAHDDRQAGIELHADTDVTGDELAIRDLEDLSHRRAEIDGPPKHFALLEEGPQPVDHLRRANIGVDDIAQDVAQLGDVGLAVVDEAERRFRIAEDRSEWLVQLMGEGAGQLAEDRRAAEVGELLLLDARLVLRTLARADVGASDHRAAFRSAQLLDRHLDPRLLHAGGLGVVELAARLSALEDVSQRRQVLACSAIAGLGGARAGAEVTVARDHAVETRRVRELHRTQPRLIDLDKFPLTV